MTMCPQPMPRPEPEATDLVPPSLPDLNQILEREISAGFPPELAFDLVLHELVVRAASTTHASAAALALSRGTEMVCRAATGLHAPDLGVPLNTHEGLSGACLRTRQPQLCADAESDPLVDAAAARRLGIRSMLIVPVCEDDAILGVLEVFASEPAAFSRQHQALLEGFASDCAHLNRSVLEFERHPPTVSQLISIVPPAEPEETTVLDSAPVIPSVSSSPAPSRLYERWTLVLGTLAILAAAGLSFIIGSRIGLGRAPVRSAHVRAPNPGAPAPKPSTAQLPPPSPPSGRNPASRAGSGIVSADELVVYDHGKVIFRMKPAPKNGDSVVAVAENTRLKGTSVWLAPEQAERRLRSRTEPTYPPAALADHRAGDVVLEVLVGEDGSVASIRTLSGDPLLATAAADAVRNWRYEPYRPNQHPTQFQTDVTLRFSLPE